MATIEIGHVPGEVFPDSHDQSWQRLAVLRNVSAAILQNPDVLHNGTAPGDELITQTQRELIISEVVGVAMSGVSADITERRRKQLKEYFDWNPTVRLRRLTTVQRAIDQALSFIATR